jgi:acyl-CoA synthetase (AMP-forming)/AMP-acid ligase II
VGEPLSGLAVGDWITTGARTWGSMPCLVRPAADQPDGRFVRTYAETNERVTRIAHALLERGLRPGDRVGILATDSFEHIELVLACLKAGITFCDLNYRLRTPELANILHRCPVTAVFASVQYAEIVQELDRGNRLGWTWLLDGDGQDLEVLVAEGSADEMAAKARGEDIVSIAFTSGTTGMPKGVLQSERMLRHIVYSGVREIRIRAGGFRYSGAPLFHISGIGSILYAVAAGCGSLVLPQFDAETVLWWLQDGGITGCTLIPTMISAILALPGARQRPYPRLESMMYGGAPMTPALLREIIDTFGCDLFNGFGAGTEAGGQTMLYPEDHVAALNGKEHLLGSIGKPIMGVDLRLCDDLLNDVPRGEIGEIVTRSETVMSGYYDQPELTARSVVDGWFRAGDMARMDDEGYLYLATRKADMIIRGGENVYPVEIESILLDHPTVRDAVVVGLPDDHWGEVVGAAVLLEDGAALDVEALRAFCRERLASYKVPEHVGAFTDLPKNATGKYLKAEVADLLMLELGLAG